MYIKQYDNNGLVANPITKEQPFINVGMPRKVRRRRERKSNNRKGHGLVVHGTIKYRIVKHHFYGGLIVHSVLVN